MKEIRAGLVWAQWGVVPLAAGLLATLAGCTSTKPINQGIDPAMAAMYAPVDEKPYRVPPVNLAKIDPQYYRQQVATPASIKEKPGTIVVDPEHRFLYLVEADGQATRYGIGVGTEGFAWARRRDDPRQAANGRSGFRRRR